MSPKKYRVPRDKTIEAGSAELLLFSPPRGTHWGRRFGLQLKRSVFPGQALLSPSAARKLAAELIRRAEDVERRP